MAAKLKKRALAEFQSQTIKQDPDEEVQLAAPTAKKQLKLFLARGGGASTAAAPDDGSHGEDALSLDIVGNGGGGRDLAATLARFQATLWARRDGGGGKGLAAAAKRLCAAILSPTPGMSKKFPDESAAASDVGSESRTQLLLALSAVMSRSELARETARDALEQWLLSEGQGDDDNFQLKAPPSAELMNLLRRLFEAPGGTSLIGHALSDKIRQVSQTALKVCDHFVVADSLAVLGYCCSNASTKNSILTLLGKYTHSTDPRVRHTAYQTLLDVHDRGTKLEVKLYYSFCRALDDDFEGVRQVCLRLVHAMAKDYPDEKVQATHSGNSANKNKRARNASGTRLRLVDDTFGRICNAINDLSVRVRELAASLMGCMAGLDVRQEFLEQTLDKKLMSNLRMKRSAHEREAKMVAAGEWSSGKKWADDAPREELDAETVSLMSFGSCGAFIHGLEDELSSVRTAAIESLTELSLKNDRMATLALDFLVDMFNDEIELVRLKAIESLRRIAASRVIALRVHQLETVLGALDDYSLVVREKLHVMLQASTVATKDGLQAVIAKLLENLRKYPQDRRSILVTFKRLGERHSELTLPLAAQILEIHPFLDTAEPDIEDPAYLCVLVLIFNAAQDCPTLPPLLDEHTRRHYHFLLDTYPQLMPGGGGSSQQHLSTSVKTNTGRFLTQTLGRVRDAEHLGMANRIKVLTRAAGDLERIGSIDPALAGPAKFAHLYLSCQRLFLKTLATRFWVNPQSMAKQQLEVVETNLAELFSSSLQLSHRFVGLSKRLSDRVNLLSLSIQALQIVFLVRASNKSALSATEQFLAQVGAFVEKAADETIFESPFLSALIRRVNEAEDHKPGAMVRLLQPLLLAHPVVDSLLAVPQEDGSGKSDLNYVAMTHAVIYEPVSMNETPLKYTAGMVLAVPVDADVFNVHDPASVCLAIKTPDQKVQLVTPKQSHLFPKDEENGGKCYRLLTEALMSHQVWSEALHVEIKIVLDVPSPSEISGGLAGPGGRGIGGKRGERLTVDISEPVKVYVLPRAAKRGSI